MAQLLKLPSYTVLGHSHRVMLSAPNEDTLTSIGSGGGSMVKVGSSFSQPFIPQSVAIHQRNQGGASFPIDNPIIRKTASDMHFEAPGEPPGGAFDVEALLAAVGGEQMHYIEFNNVHREIETRHRWPLLHIVSELLDQPEKPSEVAKSFVLYKDGVAL